MTSSLSYAIEGAEQLIADCPAFQARLGVATADEAKAHIYYFQGKLEDIGDPNNTLKLQRPFVVLNLLGACYDQFGVDDTMNLGAKGEILVQFQDNPAESGDEKSQFLDFTEFIGQVIEWIAGKVGTDQPGGNPDTSVTYFPFRTLMQETPPQRPDMAQRQSDDFYWTNWVFMHSIGFH